VEESKYIEEAYYVEEEVEEEDLGEAEYG